MKIKATGWYFWLGMRLDNNTYKVKPMHIIQKSKISQHIEVPFQRRGMPKGSSLSTSKGLYKRKVLYNDVVTYKSTFHLVYFYGLFVIVASADICFELVIYTCTIPTRTLHSPGINIRLQEATASYADDL
uniref:Uncharacterized protein n=1 Tax=Glossina austeni TaxID=7395 RepID=A0A1A9VAD3_GLOAU